MMKFDETLAKMEETFDRLSPQLKRAARYVMENTDDVALYSMRQLAAQADVHPSTMVRLARELGFDGHAQFQEPFQERLRSKPKVTYVGEARDLQQHSDKTGLVTLVEDLFRVECATFQHMDENGLPLQIVEAADEMCNARNIFAVGVRSVFPAVFYFHYACRMFTNNVHLVSGHGGTFADHLRGIGQGDVVLATSFMPYSRHTVRAVDYAKERGAKIIAVTDSTVSPIARGEDTLKIIVGNESPSLFHSIVPAMTVIEALVMVMIARGGEDVLKALEDSEEQLNGFDAYWMEKKGRFRR
ncbi:MurR/RpiR family transcriptional regulator [Magnetovibrio sp. PR-2]|uniref:MurR/RpiR family transcriptional regulator n=1 Tax=Magnetovibrio sp. PR-2 TaxID=3120356 RepID=UPI002FCDEC62